MELKFIIEGEPRTKKNSQQIMVNGRTGRRFIAPSAQYKQYQIGAMIQIPPAARQRIEKPVNVKALYYMRTRRRVDRTNLEEALLDILVDAGVLMDDNSNIVAATDGSRVLLDRERPRTEITITDMEEELHGFFDIG